MQYSDSGGSAQASGLVKIAEYTVVGSAISEYLFSGLSLDLYDFWDMHCDIYNPLTSGVSYSITLNNDRTAANYYNNFITWPTGAINYGLENIASRFSVGAGMVSSSTYNDIRRGIDGKTRFTIHSLENNGASSNSVMMGAFYNVNADITSIGLCSLITGGIGVGSRFVLYGFKK